jgi:hypothetical protein
VLAAIDLHRETGSQTAGIHGGFQHLEPKCYGWRTGRGVKIALITSAEGIKLGTTVTDKYEWNQIVACFKTYFIFGLLQKLVIIADDGRYLVIKDTIAELERDPTASRGYIERKGAFDQIYRQLHDAAGIKDIGKVPGACMKESPAVISFLLIALAMTIPLFEERGVIFFFLSLLSISLAYQLYSLSALRGLAQSLAKRVRQSSR